MSTTKQKTPHAVYAQRLAAAKRWLAKSDWVVDTPPGYDYSPHIERAIREFSMRRSRAEHLVFKAARLLRGEYVHSALGGRPVSTASVAEGDLVTVKNAGGAVMFSGPARVKSKTSFSIVVTLPNGVDMEFAVEAVKHATDD